MTIIDFSKQITDFRMERNQLHSVETIISITISAVICGAESWNEIEQFGQSKESYFRDRLINFNGIPSHDTFNRFFSSIDIDYFEREFRRWSADLCDQHQGVVAIDGKTIRSASDNSLKSKLHIVSAFSTANGISLGQVKVDDKSNEITAIPSLIEALDLSGCIVTIDAMGCQKKIAKTIIDSKADYVLCVKANQKGILEDLSEQFDDADRKLAANIELPFRRWDFYTSQETAHGMLETRRCIAYNNGVLQRIYSQWKGIQTIARIDTERINRKTGETITEKRYYITSLPLDAKTIAESVRAHWGIENNLHWQLDVSFNEDATRKKKNAAVNFSLICKMALAILKQDDKKASIVAKRKIAGWNQMYLDKLMKFG